MGSHSNLLLCKGKWSRGGACGIDVQVAVTAMVPEFRAVRKGLVSGKT